MILITGITGKVGSSAGRYLLENGFAVRGLTRDFDKAKPLRDLGAEILVGEITDTGFIRSSLEGIAKVILVMGNGPHQLEAECLVASESRAANVEHIVKISSIEAGPKATGPIPVAHNKIERFIQETGITYTFLRPNFFMQNLMLFAQSIKTSGQFSLPLGKAKTGIIDANDVGEIAARVAATTPNQSSIRALSGEALLDFYEVAKLMSKSLGREIRYNEQSHEDFHAYLAKAIPSPWHVEAVSHLFKEIAGGALESLTTDAQDILQRKPTDVLSFVAQNKFVFV